MVTLANSYKTLKSLNWKLLSLKSSLLSDKSKYSESIYEEYKPKLTQIFDSIHKVTL